jgi:malate synthase A
MGGMAAQIPIKGDEAANQAAFAKVRADKEREAGAGHDGTWVAHPDLVPVAMEVFDRLMPTSNQLTRRLEDLNITQPQMLELHEGVRTEDGMRENIRVGVRYTQAWIEGRGAVPLYNLMEDAATAEICRTQLWQWIKLSADLDDGREITSQLFVSLLTDEMAGLRRDFASPRLEEAAHLFLADGAGRRPGRVPDPAGLRADQLGEVSPPRPAYGGRGRWLRPAPSGSRAASVWTQDPEPARLPPSMSGSLPAPPAIATHRGEG